jgi:ADP-ribose pyrophosphatase YjhB (NUDIX family)
MKPSQIDTLVKLLKQVKTEGLYPPNLPEKVWNEIATLVPLPAVEVLIVKDSPTRFLLTERHDKNWNGWHIPGGFILYKESLEDACHRIAQKELGVSVRLKKFVTIYAWKNHPYGAPLSIICLCKTNQKPKDGKFFEKIPNDIISHHGDFIKAAIKEL